MWLLSCILFFLCPVKYQTSLAENYLSNLVEAFFIGIFVSIFFYVRGGNEKYVRCLTIDQVLTKKEPALAKHNPSAAATFFLGCEWNPRILGVDVKMILYAIGAIMLQLNLLSFWAYDKLHRNGNSSNAIIAYLLMFSWFIAEYMYFENVHLYTYDLFAEKIGFKLCWGCLFFYPFFYCIGGTVISWLHFEKDLPNSLFAISTSLHTAGWIITRGANLQKYYFRVNPNLKLFSFGLLVVTQECVPGTHLLCSGWWGVAKHFNYFGEILQGFAVTLPCVYIAGLSEYSLVALAYPIYYCILFVTRQIDDDGVCKIKYGEKWDEYCKIVKYRIIPGIY